MAYGFQSGFGVDGNDRVTCASISIPSVYTVAFRTYRNQVQDATRIYDATGASGVASAVTHVAARSTMQFNVPFTTTRGAWEVTWANIAGGWDAFCFAIDATSTANDPVMYVNGAAQSPAELLTPVGTYISTAAAVVLGNRAAGDRGLYGMLAEFAIWPRLLTPTDAAALAAGYTPDHIPGGAPLLYVPMLRENRDYYNATPTVTGTAVQPHPRTIMSRSSLRVGTATVAPSLQVIAVTTAREREVLFPITPVKIRLLPQLQETDTLPAIVQGADTGRGTLTEHWTASDGALGVTADSAWTRLAAGTRWTIASNQAAFVGSSSFSAEIAKCVQPASGESYMLRVPLARWRRASATDVSLGLMVRMGFSPLVLSGYAILLTQTASVNVMAFWYYQNGTPTLVTSVPVTAVEGQFLSVQVIQDTFPTTRLIGRLDGVPYLNVVDNAIPSGRYFGILGYLQGGTGDTDLQFGTLQMGVPTVGAAGRAAILTAGGLAAIGMN